MAYATVGEISDRYGADSLSALADRDGDTMMEMEAINGALDDATAEIDSYLAARYPLPLSDVPISLKRACMDIALYHLAGQRTTDEIEKRYNRAIAWLRDISKGVAMLGEPSVDKTAHKASFSTSGRLMTRTGLKGGF